MKISVLSSGSRGNCSYIETNNKKILVDLGTSSLYVEKSLKDINIDPKSIECVFLTHTHVDHVAGLKVFIKKYNPKIYLTEKMHRELIGVVDIKNYEYIDNDLILDDLVVTPIKTSHDTDDSNGYLFESNDKSIVYITDTGYINMKYNNKLKNKNIYIMESNHDIEMLMNGKYPYNIKQRILGDRGHLSNKDSAYYLSEFIGDATKNVVLIHLSQDNNTEEIAYNTLKNKLIEKNSNFNNIIISRQNERTELLEV